MRLNLSAEEHEGAISIELRVTLSGPEELSWGLDHCTPHKRCQWAVPWLDFPRWLELVHAGQRGQSLELCQPFVLLWGQHAFAPDTTAANATAVVYRNRVPDGLISRAILERLELADSLEEVDRNLAMLEIEAGGMGLTTGPVDSGDPSASLFCIHRADGAVRRPGPGPRQRETPGLAL